jgi:hypothetical protein
LKYLTFLPSDIYRSALALLCLVAVLPAFATAPVGGSNTMRFLSLSPSARVMALGGQNITIVDRDPGTVYYNPASLNEGQHRHITFSNLFTPGGINSGNVQYVHNIRKKVPMAFGMNYATYGKLTETDEEANTLGTFRANEFCFYSSAAYHFAKVLNVGATAKLFYSQFGQYSSVGMATDIAFTVNDTAHLITASLVAKNIGGQFKAYSGTNREPIPFDLQLAFAFGIKGFPLRFHLMYHDLHRWDLRYKDPNDQGTENIFGTDGNTESKGKAFGDNLARHFIFGAEFAIKKVVFLDIAYNHQRRQELKLENVRGAAGISFGLGINVKQFRFHYALAPMAQGKVANQLSLSVNTAGFVKKVKK